MPKTAAKTALDHIARVELPWRNGTPRTECGLTGTPALTADEFVAKARREGQRRTALTTCMTCFDRRVYAGRLVERDGLLEVLAREVTRVQRSSGPDARDELERELAAIVALVAAHRDEFDGLLEGLEHTTSLDKARQRRTATTRR